MRHIIIHLLGWSLAMSSAKWWLFSLTTYCRTLSARFWSFIRRNTSTIARYVASLPFLLLHFHNKLSFLDLSEGLSFWISSISCWVNPNHGAVSWIFDISGERVRNSPSSHCFSISEIKRPHFSSRLLRSDGSCVRTIGGFSSPVPSLCSLDSRQVLWCYKFRVVRLWIACINTSVVVVNYN